MEELASSATEEPIRMIWDRDRCHQPSTSLGTVQTWLLHMDTRQHTEDRTFGRVKKEKKGKEKSHTHYHEEETCRRLNTEDKRKHNNTSRTTALAASAHDRDRGDHTVGPGSSVLQAPSSMSLPSSAVGSTLLARQEAHRAGSLPGLTLSLQERVPALREATGAPRGGKKHKSHSLSAW